MLSRRFARRALCATAATLTLLVFPAAALAGPPEDAVAGANKKWFSGSFGSVSGTNCSILGGSYSETMVNGFSGYGGAPGGGVVRVGDKYWATITIGIPGNQCPNGSDIVVADLVMPPGTSFDATRQIRCFSTTRFSQTWYESTNENWDMRPIGINAYGRTCPTGPTPAFSGNGIGFDGRGLANGQMFQMFVPVVSSQALAGSNFTWVITPLASYGSFQSNAAAYVFAPGPSTPYIYYARTPSVVPFWDKTAPAGQENKAELFVNLFSNFQPGSLCYKLYAGPSASGSPILNCSGFNPTINNTSDSWYATGPGPNGGAVPFYFDPPDFGQTFTIQWTFTPSSGPAINSTPITFKALSGPDEDGDGVPNNGTDQCPTQASTNADGCPTPLSLLDPDGDGIAGDKDKCPNIPLIGPGSGCPTLTAKLGKLPKFKRSKLGKGVAFPVTCSLDTPASAVLTVSKSTAKKLKLKLKRGSKTATIATAKGTCKASGGTKLKLKLTKAAKKAVTKYKRTISAKLVVNFTPAGGVAQVAVPKSVKLT